MKKLFLLITLSTSIFLFSCQTVTKKIDEKTSQEEKELSVWLNKTESKLTEFYGKPDKVEFTNNRNRYYIYVTKKLNIKCERKFEINPKNLIIGFTSKNCF
tara:strand:+ start:68 stop:370 length:303 start_codon:yes stop_codon:yes gene_type:complete